MQETILLFPIGDKHLKLSLHRALASFPISIKTISICDYYKTLGELAGFTPEKSAQPASVYTSAELEAPMLIFAGISNKQLDQILERMRNKQIQLPYKAILTPTNAAWTPPVCFAHLKEEHASMSRK